MGDKQIKILIVEDDVIIRETFAEVFKKEGFDVIEAVDGLEGLDKANKEMPNVILTGIIMPRMDGFMFKEALMKNVATANIPVIMLSHMGREEDRKRAEELGIREFMIKGMVTPNQIVERINIIFGSREYRLKFNPNELDAPSILKDLHFNQGFKCPNCYSEMILTLKVANVNAKEFAAKFVCPKCG